MKIVVDDKIPFLKGVLEPFADVSFLPGGSIKKEDLLDADALITRTRTKCNKSLLEGTKVRFIATATIGFDHIDTEWCNNNNIKWINAPGCNSGSVYQYLASALISLSKDEGFEFKDRTLGVIGVGNVGRKIVRLGEYLGMRVMLCDPPKVRLENVCGYISKEGILRESDIITCHVPLHMEGPDKTFHLIDEVFLQKVIPGSYLINTSRGEVVDNLALKEALIHDGPIRGAVLDVWENEPDIDVELLSRLNIATPHIAGYSADGKANGSAMAVQSISKFFNLPLTRWFPENIPSPPQARFQLNCKGKTEQELISEAILHTYDIRHDDKKLRENISNFELQRGEYPLRREFNAYQIELLHGDKKSQQKLNVLGFRSTLID